MDDEVHESVEWKTLKSLRSHRTRLAPFQYQNLQMAQLSAPENDIRFLDSSLRLLFNRTDLDVLLGSTLLDPPTAEKAKGRLKSLCALLEKHVNDALVPTSPTTLYQHVSTSDYPKLTALVDLLEATNWSFELVTGEGRKIFQPDPVSAADQTEKSDYVSDVGVARESLPISGAGQAKSQVDSFHNFFDELCQPLEEDFLALTKTAPRETPQATHWKGESFRGRIVLALEALFARLATLQECNHRVLVQLPDWASIESEGLSSSRVMQLFLSTCPDSSSWQEGQIDDLSSIDATLPPIMDSICKGIRESHNEGEGLRLLIKDQKVFIADDKSHPKSYPDHCPQKTLQELIADYSFLDHEDFNPAIATNNKFLTLEKRSLAASIVLSYSIYLGCKHTIEPWNPSQVYFLARTGGHCIRDTAYALCFLDDKRILPESSGPTTSSEPPTIDLTQLAKLLLEIEFGLPLNNVMVDSNGNSARKSLENRIREGRLKLKDPGQLAYLQAVEECLKLDRTCRRRRRHQAGLGVDYTATARSVIYTDIAEKIRLASSSKRRRSSVCFPRDENLGYKDQAEFETRYRQITRPHKRLKSTNHHGRIGQPERLAEPSDTTLGSGDYGNNETQTARLSPKVDFRCSESNSFVHRSRESLSHGENQQIPRPGAVGRLRREEYTVGWICALPVELAAAQEMLDEEHEDLEPEGNDGNLYSLGSIAGHNVVIVCLPAGRIGNNPAAAVATQMRATFRGIRFGLMVGIGGGVPSAEADIRLGDVVVSQPHQTFDGVVQYDLGKATLSGFERTGSLNSPPQILLAAVARVRANELRGRNKLSKHVSKLNRIPKFQRDRAGPDVLFEATYDHEGGQTCDLCRTDRQKTRQPRESEEVVVHYGTIASGNQVIRDGRTRDRLSSKLSGVLCFEMEAAGLMNSFPCLVIRGICDYADSHKNKTWQPYAAGTAAACAKEVLLVIPPTDVAKTYTVADCT